MMTPTTAMTATPDHSLLHHRIMMMPMDQQRKKRCDKEKHHFHDTNGKGRLEHGTSLVKVWCFARIHNRSEWTERYGGSTITPACAGSAGDEAQLIDSRDQGAEETQIKECDEDGRAARAAEAEDGVDAPEDGDCADDEEDEDVGWGELVCVEEAIDKVCLAHLLVWINHIVCEADVPACQ